MTFATLSENDWIEAYRPLPSLDPSHGFDFGDGATLISGHGPSDQAVIDAAGDNRVWTVVDSDDGEKQTVVSGLRTVNRIGLIVTEKPWTGEIEVPLDNG